MSLPRWSVVIPTFDRVETLAVCLSRLAPGAQTLAPDQYEVIVTDDGSSAAPVVVSLPSTVVVTAVFCAVVAVSSTAVTTFAATVTVTCAMSHTGVGLEVSHTW